MWNLLSKVLLIQFAVSSNFLTWLRFEKHVDREVNWNETANYNNSSDDMSFRIFVSDKSAIFVWITLRELNPLVYAMWIRWYGGRLKTNK